MSRMASVSSVSRVGLALYSKLRSGLMPSLASVSSFGRASAGSLQQSKARSDAQLGISFLIWQGW